MRIDPYNHKERYLKWKSNVKDIGIENTTKENSEIILKYLNDMELGLNVASNVKKGARNYVTLNNIKQRLTFLANLINSKLNIDIITNISILQ